MSENNQKIKYFIYARKSQEAEDRQVQSIDDQLNKLKEIVKRYDLKVVDIFKEAKSAKDPDKRPLFEEMMKRIEKGEASGIICWELNRLSRNPLDSGKISLLLRDEILQSIRTYTREYKSDDNVILYNVETGMADQFVRDLKRNTNRGLESKASKGWLPSLAPTGYVNDIPTRTIKKDPERFHLVRKMWDMMLSGNYTPPQICEIANKDWGFRTFRGKNHGGKELSNSSIYRIFINLFYTGNFIYKGVEYKGNHEAMIDFSEFDKVQILLGRDGRPRPKSYEFSFTGLIKCGECGCFVTAEEKTKVIKSTSGLAKYVYYRCSKKNKKHKCNQPSVTLGDMEEQIRELIFKISISPRLRDWAIDKVKKAHEKEVFTRFEEYEMQKKAYEQTQKQIDNLVRMRYSDFISDEQYLKEKDKLQNDLVNLKARLDQTHKRSLDWLENFEKAFFFASKCKEKFDNGDIHRKREILAALGSNFVLKDKKLYLESAVWLKPFIENRESLDSADHRFELTECSKDLRNKGNEEVLASIIPIWGS